MKYFLLLLLVVPIAVGAQGADFLGPSAELAGSFCPTLVPSCGEDDCGYAHLLTLIGNIFTFITKCLAVPVATLMVAYAGIKMTISRTNPGEVEQAKKILWAAVLGLVIVLAAWLIVDTVLDELLRTDGNPQITNPLNRNG